MRPLIALLACAAALFTVWPAQAQAAPATKRLAVVVIQNGDTDGERAQLSNTDYFRNIFFGTSGSLASWMPAVSHGQLTYVPAGDGVFTTEPNDELRNGAKNECHSGPARKTAEDHLAAQGIAYDAVAVVFDIGPCPWAGLGQMPGRVTWYPPKPSLSAIVHEVGHNQGYPHQGKKDCAGGSMAACKSNGYSGNTPMGSGGAGRGYSSVELLHSGWIRAAWRAQAGKPGVFTLKPLYAPASVGGARVVEYRAAADLTYVIELRAPVSGVDTAISNPGVRVYAVSGNDYKNAQMVNPGSGGSSPMVPAGSKITDVANKVTITVRSSSASSATVAVEAIGASPSPSIAPSPTPSGEAEASPTPDVSGWPSPDSESDIVSVAEVPRPTAPSRGWIYVVVATAFALILIAVLFARPHKIGRAHV